MNRYLKIVLTSVLFLSAIISGLAQPIITINDASTPANSEVTLDFVIDNVANIGDIQFSINWDNSQLSFVEVASVNDAIFSGISVNDFDESDTGNGNLVFQWTEDMPNSIGQVGDDILMFQLTFATRGSEGDQIPISISGMPVAIRLIREQNGSGTDLGAATTINNGTITLLEGIPDVNFTITPINPPSTICNGDQLCYDLKVSDFDNILGMQFIITWSGSALEFNNFSNFGLEGFDENTLNVDRDTTGTMPLAINVDSLARGLWSTETAEGLTNGISLPDETILVTMCFDVIGEDASSSTIQLVGDGTTPQEIFNIDGQILDFISNPRTVNVEDCASLISFATRCQDIQLDETVCLDFTTTNFTDIIESKYTVFFDTTLLEFVNTDNHNPNLANFDANNITVDGDRITFDWQSTTSATVENGATLFSGCFKAIGPVDSVATIDYVKVLGALTNVTNASGQSLDPQFTDCDITILPPTVGLIAPIVSTPPNTDICVELTVENFLNIGHIEMPIEWDPAVLEFINVNTTGLTGLTSGNFDFSNVDQGRVVLETWDSPIPEGLTLPDSSGIFELCFRVIGNLGTSSPIIFPPSNTTPVFIQNANGQILEISTTDGNVTVETSGLVLSSEAQEVRRNNSFCVDISTSNFNQIVSLDYSHLYDPAVLRFDSVQVSGAISNLIPNNIVSANEGTIRVGWFSEDTDNGTTVADGTTLYSLCFTTIGDLGACSNFRLDNVQDITTVQSAGEDIGTFDSTNDLCIDNFGITVIDSLRPSCNGGDGQIRLGVSGDPGEDFLFSVTLDGNFFITGQNVENDSILLNSLVEGEYSIQVFSIADITKSETRVFNLNLSPADFPSITLSDDIDAGCVEENEAIAIILDGSTFTLPPTSGNGQFFTQWTALGTGQLVDSTANGEITTALAPGRYVFTAGFNDTGCISSDTIDVFTTPIPNVQVSQGGILGCTNSTLQLEIEVIDDNPNNVHQWTTNDGNILSGATTFSPIIDQEGIYKFMTIDTINGCIGFDSTFVFRDTFPPDANAGPDLEIGCNDNFVSLAGIGSTGALVEWTTTDGSSIFYPDTSDQSFADVTRVGTYIFRVTNQVNGCEATDTMMINADESLPVARAEDLAIIGCGTNVVTLDASTSSQGSIFSYQWLGPNNDLLSIEDTIQTATTGTHLFIVTNDDSQDCKADTASIMVIEDKTEPQTSITQVLTLDCSGDCTPLEANVPDGDHFAYQWETPDGLICSGANSPIVKVQSAGVYNLHTIDLNNNCESMDATIVGTDGPGADAGAAQQIDCNNEVVTLDGRGSDNSETISFSWRTADSTEISTELSVEVSVPGEYTLELMDSATGCMASSRVVVTESREAPIAEAGEAPIIAGCEFPTGRRLDGTASDFGDNIIYAWESSIGIIVGDTSIAAPEIGSPGTFVLTVTNTTNGCFSMDEVTVQSDVMIPVANAGGDRELSCDEPELTLAGISEALPQGSTIRWMTNDGNIVSGADQLFANIDAPGTYLLSITSADQCVTTDTVIVSSSIDAPEANAGQALTITCNNNLILEGTGTTGDNIAISWTTMGGNIIEGADTYTPEINRGGSYTLSVINTDNNCETTSLVIITDSEELPVADAGVNQEICTNESALNAIQPLGDFTGSWTTLEQSMIVSPTDANSTVADLAEGNNTYIWTLSNETCGDFSSDTVLINVPTLPMALDDVFEIQPEQNSNAINLIENDQANSDMFNVNILVPPTIGELTETSPGTFEFTTPARYFGAQQFQYEICSAACSELCDDANVRVVVLPGPDVDTTNTVPNAITPNGDGMNDILLIDELIFDAVDFPQSELVIFNRWGDVVFKASPYNNDWAGTANNGDNLPEGTYYYILRLDIVEGEVMKGDITILR